MAASAELVDNHMPNGVGELNYARFQLVLNLIVQDGRQYVVIKGDIKGAFRNVPVAQYSWLLACTWNCFKAFRGICAFAVRQCPVECFLLIQHCTAIENWFDSQVFMSSMVTV